MEIKNKIYKTGLAGIIAIGLAAFTGCSDDFLAEKKPYGSFGPDLVYGDWSSVKLRLNYIYQRSLPYFKGYNTQGGRQVDNCPPDFWPVGLPDLWTGNTDEFPGYGVYMDPSSTWDNTTIHKYFYFGINESPWKKMRECTDVIVRTKESTTLTDIQKQEVEAQARFFRATRYYRLFKRFGGVPIVRGLQSTLMGDRDSLAIPRHSTEETVRFIIDDLKYAGEHLPARWEEEAVDWGRITSGCAYAMAGIVANYYASPIFNRSDDKARWDSAYVLNKKAIEKLKEGHFGLSYSSTPGKNASNWAKIWCNVMAGESMNSEGVYMAMCNNVEGENDLYNCWEQNIRPSNANGGGGIAPSAEIVDEFPMADGKRPTETGKYTYNKKLFFLNRDPRFYRTFAFPGVKWEFSGTIGEDRADQCPYLSGTDYELWDIAWYSDQATANNTQVYGYYTDLLGETKKGSIYVRKKSQDYLLGEKPLYNFQNNDGFKMNGQPLLTIRYTEVLLNLAEAACGIGNLEEAYGYLKQIRERVGYTGDCGLDPAIIGNRAKMFEAILYERKIELAYEGKSFDDAMRWMLFDGGEGQSELGSNYTLTGWDGNTCKYLGVTPLKDRILHAIEICFDPSVFTGKYTADADPFTTKKFTKPKALDLTEDFTGSIVEDEEGTSTMNFADKKVQALAEFYSKNLLRKDVETMTKADSTGNANPHWDKKLYLMGLEQGDQENNPGVVQTVGWQSRFGGMGIFDPLSDKPQTSITKEEDEKPATDTTTEAK